MGYISELVTMTEIFAPVPASDAGIQGPVVHAVWKSSEAPNDIHGHEYLHTMLQMKALLASICMDYALRKPCSGVGAEMLTKFYNYFCAAFVNPELTGDLDAVTYKERLMDAMNLYNAEIERTGAIPRMLGRPGFMDLAWDGERKQFEFPTLQKMLTSHWIISNMEVIMRMAELRTAEDKTD